jgi:Flp pilus assembly pilin Flp
LSTSGVAGVFGAIREAVRREDGQGFVEYVVLIALIALALFLAITFFSDQLGAVFSAITEIIQNNLPPS